MPLKVRLSDLKLELFFVEVSISDHVTTIYRIVKRKVVCLEFDASEFGAGRTTAYSPLMEVLLSGE